MRADLIDSELDTLGQYVRIMRSALNEQQRLFDEQIKKQKHRMSPQEFNQYCDWQVDQYSELNEIFPQIMRESTFVALMSKLEHDMVALCRLIGSNWNVSAQYRKLRRQTTFESVRSYIKNQTGIDVGAQRRWKSVNTLNAIRNAIVHNDGRVSPNKLNQVNLYAYRNHQLLSITTRRHVPRNNVVLKDRFLEHVIDITGEYLKSAYRKLLKLGI